MVITEKDIFIHTLSSTYDRARNFKISAILKKEFLILQLPEGYDLYKIPFYFKVMSDVIMIGDSVVKDRFAVDSE